VRRPGDLRTAFPKLHIRGQQADKRIQKKKVPKKHFRPVSEADQTKTARNAWHSLHIQTIQNPKAQQQHQIAS
jgi:hypothetical protein